MRGYQSLITASVAFRGEEWHYGPKTGNPTRKGRCRMSEFKNVTVVQNAWKKIKAGEQFTVPANSKFNLKAAALTDYICSFVK
jgi:uncharacterized protein YaiE (UPF0345 family)